MARKKRKRKLTFRTLDGAFASPRSRRKLSVFVNGRRIHGAAATGAIKTARGKLVRPTRKKPARKAPTRKRAPRDRKRALRDGRRRGKPKIGRLPSKKQYNSTFRNFLEPIGNRSDRSQAIVFALVRVTYTKYTESPVRVLPIDMGSMTVSRARKITEEQIIRRTQRTIGRTKVEVLGVFALKGSGRRGDDKVRRKIAKRKLR